ncbi:LARGE xylosyl- and glucuronyltransferase 2 [Frankliniella fusca]|uniref:LARGE xylosyl- and glucuronyltransferase 2 n=1 Tax=Frankliniella fusca TaxID=407009 RepID=A0AAE1HFH5_9NEOP|nr:LARGE xylosyl- and glucuronyltransferase 2 [Frankliniella fusca]KAK3920399.1 LARGE xylosyl- and glucuronyltransferase 2 [Frankliniella fusca]
MIDFISAEGPPGAPQDLLDQGSTRSSRSTCSRRTTRSSCAVRALSQCAG